MDWSSINISPSNIFWKFLLLERDHQNSQMGAGGMKELNSGLQASTMWEYLLNRTMKELACSLGIGQCNPVKTIPDHGGVLCCGGTHRLRLFFLAFSY